jgi:hypothetical protein
MGEMGRKSLAHAGVFAPLPTREQRSAQLQTA